MSISKTADDIKKRDIPNDLFYTPSGLAKRCIDIVPIVPNDVVLDPARGKGAYFNNFPEFANKEWCEFDEGKDFMMWNNSVDWVITNPPYSALNRWIEKACSVSYKGFGYLIHLHSITPKRISLINGLGFGFTKIYICKVYKWFGMSAFCLFEKDAPNIIMFDREVWR